MTDVEPVDYSHLVGKRCTIWAMCPECGTIETQIETAAFEFCGTILEFDVDQLIAIEGYDDGYGYHYRFDREE